MVNCSALFHGDRAEQARVLARQPGRSHEHQFDVPPYLQEPMSCSQFIRERKYMMKPASAEEASFPLAFSLLLHRHIEQLERLLRAVYRPQNHYCVHLDQKAPPRVHHALRRLAGCFHNVEVASRPVWVRWGQISVILPEIVCMRDLWRHRRWKYFINLTGQEWPLKTNGQLVRILKTYNGGNDIEGTARGIEKGRWEWHWFAGQRTSTRKLPFKHNVTFTKGALHMTASRGFVDYVLHSPVAQEFLDWLSDTDVPDESFFSSLNHSPQLGVPGAYTGEPETDGTQEVYWPGKPYMTRYKVWRYKRKPCHGWINRGICVFGIKDLPALYDRRELFLNKVHLDLQPDTLNCLEQLHHDRVHRELQHGVQLDEEFYRNMPWVKHHV